MRLIHHAPFRALLAAVALLGLAACGESPPETPAPIPAPPEARSALQAFLTALKDGKGREAASHILADQRSGALGLTDDLPWKAEGSPGRYTAAMTFNILFFAEIRDFEVGPDEESRLVHAEEARLPVRLLYADDLFADRVFILRATNEEWHVDLKATLESWHERHKDSAFAALKPKASPAEE